MRRLFLDETPGERRGVVALNGQPEHLFIEREGEAVGPRLGEIWRARVGAAATAFRGVFVDLGEGGQALMPNAPGAQPPEGRLIRVEIQAEARSGKSPLVRNLGSAEGQPGLEAAAADLEARLTAFAPDAAITRGAAAREAADLAEEAALAEVHDLAGGLSLALERTRGMTAVDVDFSQAQGGKRAVLSANLRAVPEAARLLRLKGLGGLVVIDLIGKASEHPEILAAAKAAFEADQPGVVIAGLSRLGVLEVALPWGRTPVGERLLDPDGGPTILTLAHRLVRLMLREATADPGARILARAGPSLSAVAAPLIAQLGPMFSVASDAALGDRAFQVRAR